MLSSSRGATRERLLPTVALAPDRRNDLTVATPDRRLVFVVGPGRSGTSSMAGALSYSGYQIPEAIDGDETNPSGFFEPCWVVDFHTALLLRCGVGTLDTDPIALERVNGISSGDGIREELSTWLSERLHRHDRVVIKDPRMVWFAPCGSR